VSCELHGSHMGQSPSVDFVLVCYCPSLQIPQGSTHYFKLLAVVCDRCRLLLPGSDSWA
jgi:hypothetical protein